MTEPTKSEDPSELESKGETKEEAIDGEKKLNVEGNNYLRDEKTGNYLYKDPNDGTLYEWDADKYGWFPKIDDDFMAHYQLNYGFNNDGKTKANHPLGE